MTEHFSYSTPFGPHIRIGMVQGQGLISFGIVGQYDLFRDTGERVRTLKESKQHLTAHLRDGRPARLGYALILARTPSHDEAQQRLAEWRAIPQMSELRIVLLGHTFSSQQSKVVSSAEYCVCTPPYKTRRDAAQAREKLPRSEQIDILEERLEPPSGTVYLEFPDGTEVEGSNFLRLAPHGPEEGRIILRDVIVGVEFHWRHKENQKLRGALEIRIDNKGLLTAINELPLEAYLFSVNSSEMMSVCPPELLKAQTIAARNTVLATMGKHHYADDFHLCADDHCQCYRGSSRESLSSYRGGLETLGHLIAHQDHVCDTRYSKICGGIMEAFDSVWHGNPVPYMVTGFDGPADSPDRSLLPADDDDKAQKLIGASPDVYCNTTRGDVPPYLRYSAKYFRWIVSYTREELENLLNRFPEYRVGKIRDLIPLSRGKSGRIEYLKVIGTKGEVTIGKEFEIRKALSDTFLYSSCFVPELVRKPDGSVERIVLRGGGWGHGAGLCQIGAAMMAYRGKTCQEILSHYYKNTALTTLYEEPIDVQKFLKDLQGRDFRIGDRCFEFFNCYAVAQCPIYLENKDIVCIQEKDSFVFIQDRTAPDDLESLNIQCEFLTFRATKAYPKK
jgi:stage II sporulation protein D